jgi:hypothetical protein
MEKQENLHNSEEAPKSELAEGIEKDERVAAISQELTENWKKENGEIWKDGLLRSEYQDFMFGNPSDNNSVSLEERSKNVFEERFPEDAEKYREIEKTRIYDHASEDPAFKEIEKNITAWTNTDPRVKDVIENKGGNYVETWERANLNANMRGWNMFADRYPEKAKAYMEQNDFLKRILAGREGEKKVKPDNERRENPEATDYKDKFKGTYGFFKKFEKQSGERLEAAKENNKSTKGIEKENKEFKEILASLESGDVVLARGKIDSMMQKNFENIKENVSDQKIVLGCIGTLTQLYKYRIELDKSEKGEKTDKTIKVENKEWVAQPEAVEGAKNTAKSEENKEWIGDQPGGARMQERMKKIEEEELNNARKETERGYQSQESIDPSKKLEKEEGRIDIAAEAAKLTKEKEEEWAREINLKRANNGEKFSEGEAYGELLNKFLGELGYSVEYRGILKGKARLRREVVEPGGANYVMGEWKKKKGGMEASPREFKTSFSPEKKHELLDFLRDELIKKQKRDLAEKNGNQNEKGSQENREKTENEPSKPLKNEQVGREELKNNVENYLKSGKASDLLKDSERFRDMVPELVRYLKEHGVSDTSTNYMAPELMIDRARDFIDYDNKRNQTGTAAEEMKPENTQRVENQETKNKAEKLSGELENEINGGRLRFEQRGDKWDKRWEDAARLSFYLNNLDYKIIGVLFDPKNPAHLIRGTNESDVIRDEKNGEMLRFGSNEEANNFLKEQMVKKFPGYKERDRKEVEKNYKELQADLKKGLKEESLKREKEIKSLISEAKEKAKKEKKKLGRTEEWAIKKDYYEKNLNPLPPAGYDSGKKGDNKIIKMLEGKMAEQDMMVLMWERETKRESAGEAGV